MWSQVWVWQIKVFVGWTELDFFNYMYLYVNRLESIVSYKILFSALKHTLLPPEVVMGNLVLLACKAGRSTWQGSYPSVQFSSIQSLSGVWLFATPWTAARQASLSITNSWSFLELMLIESVMPSNHLILCHPLLLLPSIFPSIRVFSHESVLCIRWPKYWSFSSSISPSNEYSGLVSFRIDWFDLLAVQGTLKSLLQHHSSKASILQLSAFFMV